MRRNSTTTYDPGLTDAPRTVTFDATQTFGTDFDPTIPCTVPAQPTITGGIVTASGTLMGATCLQPLGPSLPPHTTTFHWNDGSQSTVLITTAVVTNLPGIIQIEQTGTVQSGFGTGSTMVETISLVSPALTACLDSDGPGVRKLAGPIVLTFS